MASSSRQCGVTLKLKASASRSRVPAVIVQGWLRRQAGLGTAAATLLFLLTAGAGQPAQAQTSTPQFTSVYSFSGADGANPYGGVVEDSSGNIYGTTYNGGVGAGTVFKIGSSGESVCYSFQGGSADGAYPAGGLLLSGGYLYGTTTSGSLGKGTVFKVPTSCGSDSVLHSFGTISPDGANPASGLTVGPSGYLYGTTHAGGLGNSFVTYGTVFAVDPASGAETYFYQFQATSGDGTNPHAGLISDQSGNLYGTTEKGGTYGYGTVFKIDTSGNESVLYSFGTNGSADGSDPYGELVRDSTGNLYGTTQTGGTYGLGTVFKIDTSGNETVLYNFSGGPFTGGTNDGAYPEGGVVMDSAGNLYGTTWWGGDSGDGTVFEISSSGTKTTLHSFNGTDGALPQGALMLDSSNVLWGTTRYGGTDPSYNGTVFKIALPASSVPLTFTSAKLDATAGPPAGFDLQAYFTAGSGGDPIDVDTYGLTLTVGNYTVTIPASVFKQVPKGWWVTQTTINNTSLEVRVSQPTTTTYELQFEETGTDITSGPNPATITLSIGNNTGTTTASF